MVEDGNEINGANWFAVLYLLSLIAVLEGQLLVGTAVAEQCVLCRPVKTKGVLGYVWAVHFVFTLLSRKLWNRAVSWNPDGRSWVCMLGCGLGKIILLLAFGKTCWYRTE